jgi:ribosomal protein L40E
MIVSARYVSYDPDPDQSFADAEAQVAQSLVCWKCGASLDGLPLPLGRREECPQCHADLHVCRLCEFHDPSVSRGCREPVADEVGDKERANFCGYFTALPSAHRPADSSAADEARAKLSDLFGDPEGDGAERKSEADAARQDLERLFGTDETKDR